MKALGPCFRRDLRCQAEDWLHPVASSLSVAFGLALRWSSEAKWQLPCILIFLAAMSFFASYRANRKERAQAPLLAFRVTPLPAQVYFLSKILASLLFVVLQTILLFVAAGPLAIEDLFLLSLGFLASSAFAIGAGLLCAWAPLVTRNSQSVAQLSALALASLLPLWPGMPRWLPACCPWTGAYQLALGGAWGMTTLDLLAAFGSTLLWLVLSYRWGERLIGQSLFTAPASAMAPESTE